MAEAENTVDILMSLDPLELTSDNIDAIIAYHRKARAGGAKPRRESGPKVDISNALAGIMGEAAPATAQIRRR